jgi:hypothetical protein
VSADVSSDQPEKPATFTVEPSDSGCGVLMFGFLVIASIWMACDGAVNTLIPAYRARLVYVQTEATVLETDLDVGRNEGKEVCHPRVRLRYDTGGATREEWTHLDWAEPVRSPDQANADLQAYPVGGRVTAWYDPAQPGRVVLTRDAGFAKGWMLVIFGLLLTVPTLGFLIVLPFVWLVIQARRDWFVLEQTTGRVVGGEVREVQITAERFAYQPAIWVEYDHCAAAYRGAIRGDVHLERSAAEAELAALLTAHPVGEQKLLRYDPRGSLEPTFEPPLTFGTFLVAGTLILLRPALVMLGALVSVGHRMGWELAAPRRGPVPRVPAWRRLLLIVSAVLAIALTVRYVFRQDYQCYYELQPVTGKVLESVASRAPYGGFEPRVRFGYTVNDQYYERWTHAGWHSARLSTITREEAEEMVAPYPAGSEVTVWYDPDWPLMGVIKRYTRWYLYPIVLPPLWVLVVQTRKLLRRQS